MTPAYLAATGRRFSFMVAVFSSPPGSGKAGRTAKRLICSARDLRQGRPVVPARFSG
jgi:hypothetical protein